MDVVAARAAPPRPRSRCSRCRARRSRCAAGPSPRRPGCPTSSLADDARRPATASIASRASTDAAIVRSSSASPWMASWRRAASSEAISSDDGDVERTSRTARATASGSIRPVARDVQHRRLRERADDLVRRGQHRVGAERQGGRRQRRVEAEVRPPGLVDDQRHAGRVARPRRARRRRRPSRSRSARRRTPHARPASRASAALERLRRDAVRHAELVVVLRRDERRRPPDSTSPSITEACELRCTTTRRAERRERERTARGCPGWRRW